MLGPPPPKRTDTPALPISTLVSIGVCFWRSLVRCHNIQTSRTPNNSNSEQAGIPNWRNQNFPKSEIHKPRKIWNSHTIQFPEFTNYDIHKIWNSPKPLNLTIAKPEIHKTHKSWNAQKSQIHEMRKTWNSQRRTLTDLAKSEIRKNLNAQNSKIRNS